MSRTYVPNAARRRHELAELAERTTRQRLPAHNPTIKAERLREIALARRRLAAAQAKHLLRRGITTIDPSPDDDAAARWAKQSIRNLLDEEREKLAEADELERAAAQ